METEQKKNKNPKKKIIIAVVAAVVLLIAIVMVVSNPCIIGKHTYNNGVTTKAATCVAKGERLYTCTECERKTYTREIPISNVNHNWGEFVITKEGSGCDVNGEKERICKDCGDKDTASAAPPLEHSYGEWKLVGSDETKKTYERTCTRCGKKVNKQEAVNTNNSYGSSYNSKCINCNGTGTVKFYYGSSDLEAYLSGHDPYTYGDCPMCHGKGY